MLSPHPDTPFIIQLSFEQVINTLKAAEKDAGGERLQEIRLLLEEADAHPELREGITTIAQAEQNQALIAKLMADYFPQVLSSNEIKAVAIPYRNLIFNHTSRFESILRAAGKGFEINIRDFDEHQFYVLSCCLILNEFYGTHLDFGKPLFYDIPAANGTVKHYRILYNADNLDIIPTADSVPLSQEDIDRLIDNYDDLALWKEKFPRNSWILKGFAIMTLFDATVENAVSIFKEKLLVLNANGLEESVESIFRSIYRIPDISVGFTVFKPDEGKFSIANFGQHLRSYLLPDQNEQSTIDVLCINSFQSLIRDRVYFAISDVALYKAQNPASPLAQHLVAQDIGSFILAPVTKNNVLLGVLELVSPRPQELNSINANKLQVVMPFLTDSIERLIADMQNQVHAFIQEKYTTIHSSVYWKFKQEAQLMLAKVRTEDITEPDEIVFEKVYPLYGQVDIKGSSEVRNSSVQQDVKNQVSFLLTMLQQLHQPGFEEETLQMLQFLEDLQEPLRASTEQVIHNYIHSKIHTPLRTLTQGKPMAVVDEYFRENNKATGSFHIFRRRYEHTISTINNQIAEVIDSWQENAQAIFPHYYERFKTDGVEHNLYIGASIAPQQAFHKTKVHQLRLWQIRVLCAMERAHAVIKPSLPYQLDVTTLILVYNTEIAIRFRMDEKRFDVDGSYNARFEIIKKRIDKACIKDTQERITQAGMLTIVYSSRAEEMEYAGYVAILQEEHIVGNTMEILDVEELQGVSGLKAIRVPINRQ